MSKDISPPPLKHCRLIRRDTGPAINYPDHDCVVPLFECTRTSASAAGLCLAAFLMRFRTAGLIGYKMSCFAAD